MGLRTFDRLESEGVIAAASPGRGGRPSLYDLTVTVPAYLAHERKRLGAGVPAEDARARRDRSQAELNELRLAEHRKELLPRERVVIEGQAFAKALQAKLRALPRRMVQAGIVTREHEPAAAALVREALEEISRWTSMADLLAAAKEAS
jgi:hypothetical protein